jgi:hypothetical protein
MTVRCEMMRDKRAGRDMRDGQEFTIRSSTFSELRTQNLGLRIAPVALFPPVSLEPDIYRAGFISLISDGKGFFPPTSISKVTFSPGGTLIVLSLVPNCSCHIRTLYTPGGTFIMAKLPV